MGFNLFRIMAFSFLSGLITAVLALPSPEITYTVFTSTTLLAGAPITPNTPGTIPTTITAIKILFHDTVVDSRNTWFNDFTRAWAIAPANLVLQVQITNLLPVLSVAQLVDITTKIANFINIWIGTTTTITIDGNFHFIGHGQGAHIAGMAARKLNDLKATPTANAKVSRLTGLNPTAFTNFVGKFDPDISLHKTDAKFIDIIHTECVIFGSCEVMGDADFYPNGALVQPGCMPFNPLCSHERSTKYYVDSVTNPDSFVSRQCESYFLFERGFCATNAKANMGNNLVVTDVKGKYYLKTKSDPPYGLK